MDSTCVKVHESANGGGKTTDKAVGRTRGGLNTKLHTIVDGLGNPVTFLLSAGNAHDSTHAVQLLEQLSISGSSVLVDRTYGAASIRTYIQGEYKLAEEEYNLTAQKCTHFNRDVREILHTMLLLQTQGWETAEANFSRIRQDHKENPYVRNLRYKIVCAKLKDKKVPLYEQKKLEEEKTQLATSKMLDPFQQFQCYDPQLS